jgi:hypothetical protein
VSDTAREAIASRRKPARSRRRFGLLDWPRRRQADQQPGSPVIELSPQWFSKSTIMALL